MTDQTIRDASGEYVSGSLENVKSQGEVMTPPHIVEAMLAQIDPIAWNDPSYVFMEPCCGTGNFLVALAKKRIESGIEIETVFNTIVGMDINCITIHEARGRLVDVAMKHCDDPKKLKRIKAIVYNNIFLTVDSLRCIKGEGLKKGTHLKDKRWVYESPTKNRSSNKIHEEKYQRRLEQDGEHEYYSYETYIKKGNGNV